MVLQKHGIGFVGLKDPLENDGVPWGWKSLSNHSLIIKLGNFVNRLFVAHFQSSVVKFQISHVLWVS